MKYSTYLFDLDGTLIDSMSTFVNTLTNKLDENNVKYGADFVKTVTPLGKEGIADYLIELGLKTDKACLMEWMDCASAAEYKNSIPAKSNVISALKELKRSGASLNVLTASPHVLLDPCLERLGIADLFCNLWSCDDFGTSKTNPMIYKSVADRLNVPVEGILFLDDNINAVKTAKSAGMTVCGVYDSYSDEYVELIKEAADYYIYDFSELSALV